MTDKSRTELNVPLERIFLDLNNPRHEPFQTQGEAITYLCAHEEVPQLARDIAANGLSPFDRFGVTIVPGTEGERPNYTAAEGNRRVCALILLSDPDLAPPELRSHFEELATQWTPIQSLPCVSFEDADDLHLWLGRRHHGVAGGIGQKPWKSDQQARHAGGVSRNTLALNFLDFAETSGIISADARKRQITTVQRFLSNPVMRETLGLDTTDPDQVKRNRTSADFLLLTKQFIKDLLDSSPDSPVTSRKRAQEIANYGRSLSALPGQSHSRIEPEPIHPAAASVKKTKPKPKPKAPNQPARLPWRPDISTALEELANWKLQTLYHSLGDVPLKGNVTLLSVGCWSFMETVTAAAGRKSGDFVEFLPQSKLVSLGLGSKDQVKALSPCLNRIQQLGNASKHHATSSAFNADQLYNDMDTLGDTILKVIELARAQDT